MKSMINREARDHAHARSQRSRGPLRGPRPGTGGPAEPRLPRDVADVGERDQPFLAAPDYMAAKIPNASKVVIPGAGHHYCERYRDALIAFLLNGAMIYAAYEAFDHDNEGLGGLITFFEIGLYSGNIYSAVNSAHKYNRKQKRDFFQYLKEHSMLEASATRLHQGQALALSYKITF